MKKIAIIGPESTGKTALARALAAHFGVPWVPEYAREYVENLDEHYTFEDVCKIAHHQIKTEEGLENNDVLPLVFFDTDLIITKVWFEFCYQQVPEFVTERLSKKFFDLYLLCEPDLPWEEDPVREHGDERDFFYFWYKKEIVQLGTPYIIVNGTGEDRILNALKAIKKLNL